MGYRTATKSVLAALTTLILTTGASPLWAQGPSIEELHRLVDERESEIVNLEERLDGLEQRADSLSRAKREITPGGPEFEAISNEILDSSLAITQVARQLRTLYEQVRDLNTELFFRYNAAIPETQRRIDELTEEGRTTETSAELRRLIGELEALVRAREDIAARIEEAEDDLLLPELTLDPTDGPSELRVKEAIARDAVDKIDTRIAAIDDQMEEAQQRQRDLEEFQRIKSEIDLWGDSQATLGGSQIEAVLQGRAPGADFRGSESVFDDRQQRIRSLQEKRLDLVDRRREYEAKAEQFANRLQEFYR